MSRLRHPFGHQPPDEREDSKVFSIARSGGDEMDRVKSCCGGQPIV